ncbi:MAG: hypothetical protein HC854_12625 [Flavobacterium sp.]|nr:hypothetical protein [Flavobacterium sp.]
MKNIKIKLLGLSFLFALSCNTDDNTNNGTREASDAKASVVVNFSQTTPYNEGDEDVLSYTITLDKPQIADIYADVSFVSGTATEGEDFNFDHVVVIPANQISATGTISILKDIEFETTETLTLKIGSNRFVNAAFTPVQLTVNIGNFQENNLTIDLSWDGTFTGASGPTDFCDVDMDLELLNSAGDYVETSYSDCPEQIIISSTLPDDTYTLVVSLWTNNGETAVLDIPANLDIYKVGSQTTYSGDLSTFFPLADGGLDNGNSNAFLEYTIVKSGTTFTVTDQNSVQVLQGRTSNFSQLIKSKILNKNKNKII